jgi:UDP:flavonoid glycosyltransferase YjiC (YdhE family)
MSRFLIATTAFVAHADWGGLLGTARQLVAAGHEVLWATGTMLAPYIRARGLAVREIAVVDPHHGGDGPPTMTGGGIRDVVIWRLALRGLPAEREVEPHVLSALNFLVRALVDAWLQVDAVVKGANALIRLIDEWHPDVIVAEPLMLPAALAAEARGRPLASCGYPGALLRIPEHSGLARTRDIVRRRTSRIRTALQLHEQSGDAELFFAAESLQIVYLPPDWFGPLGAPASPNVCYVGSARPRDVEPRVDADARAPLVVLAVASSYAPSDDVLNAMFDGVRRVGGTALIGGVPERAARADGLPSHVRCAPWLDYDAVLPGAAALVHHGGLGTTHAAVRAAIPQVVLPGAIDQCLHADAVVRAGAGRASDEPPDGAAIAAMLGDVLACASYRANAVRLREHFARFGGVPRAVERLQALARTAPIAVGPSPHPAADTGARPLTG